VSAQDTERAAALERRYRRLLRCYPPGHREVHREEMLGVLLATARPGQRAPGGQLTGRRALAGRPGRRQPDHPGADAHHRRPVFIASLAACSLAFSAGPRRGLAIVGRRQVCLMIAALAGVFGVPDIVLMVRASVPVAASTVSLLFAVLVWPVAIASWRGRVRRSSHALPA
jgi:hypothetical protein